MATRRERLLNRAERLREWAEKREKTATAALNSHPEIRHDWAFITQPGHIPLRARMNASDDRAHASLVKAADMESRAAGIEDQVANAIYSDDPDAVESLEAKIAGLEAERDRIKRYNITARKGAHDPSILTDKQREELAVTLRVQPYSCKGGAFPGYALTNLSGNIKRLRDRIEDVKRRADRATRAEAAGGILAVCSSDHTYGNITFTEKPAEAILAVFRSAWWRYSGGTWSGDLSRLPEAVPDAAEEWQDVQRAIKAAQV